MASRFSPSDEQTALRVRRGRVDSVDLYEIKDSELDILEKGSPADLQLNFAIFLLSTAFNGVCTLAAATFSSARIENLFTLVTLVSTVIGTYLFIAWFRSHRSLRELCRTIRKRIPPDVVAPTPGESPSDED